MSNMHQSGFNLGFFVGGRSQYEWTKAKSILGGAEYFGNGYMCSDAIWCIKIFIILRHNSE